MAKFTCLLPIFLVATFVAAGVSHAAVFHVATNGKDANPGTKRAPFRTIQRAADVAQPGDTIRVHEGVYRERVNPPRGGTTDKKRIVYQAAPGEKVTITGSEIVKGWVKVTNDTWKVTLPNDFFGNFNPYRDIIRGDWFTPKGRPHHTGAVYVNGHWLIEAAKFEDVLQPAGDKPVWFTDHAGDSGAADYLLNLASLGAGQMRIAADTFSAKSGELRPAPCAEGGNCIGWIRSGSWLRFDTVDFGAETNAMEVRVASQTSGGVIEFRAGGPQGEVLGTVRVPGTGDWQKWITLTAPIKPASRVKALCLVFKAGRTEPEPHTAHTSLWAQFIGIDPNANGIEINVRQSVFYPDKPGRDYITVRGFTLENAATPWAPPTAEQIGLIGTHWSKGWIIEDNVIRYSKCSGVALGKHGDAFDNTSADTAEGYVETIQRAHQQGWSRANIGHHIVRNNHISHCEQAGVVGSMGCSFSTVTGNEIHDIYVHRLFTGAEMGGIKFHGAVDVVISHNHIYRVGGVAGLWLDWMAQGTRVTANLFHDNSLDLFLEVNHGPFVVDNNLFLSGRTLDVQSDGGAFAHNLIAGELGVRAETHRVTPYLKGHATDVVGLRHAPVGDARFHNNLLIGAARLSGFDAATLPVHMAGNVFIKSAAPSMHEAAPLLKPDFDPRIRLVEKPDGWFLELALDKAWGSEQPRKLVTTALLGKAVIPDLPFENTDGSELRVNKDFFARRRDAKSPFPGPFEKPLPAGAAVKVWPIGIADK